MAGPQGSDVELALEPFEKKGETIQLKVSAFDRKDRYMGVTPVEWDVTNRRVATVSRTGLVTILSSGSAEVIARTTETKVPVEARLPIEAIIPVEVRITEPKVPDGERIELPMGEFLQFRAEVINDRDEVIDDAEIAWSSTTYAATVVPSGEVEGRAIGNTEILAEYRNARPARVEMFVTDWPPGKRRGPRR